MAYSTVPAKSPGDVFSATPMWETYIKDNLNKGVIRPIAETTLASAAASIDFTSIAADWSHLMLVLYARGDAASALISARFRFNGDTAANYDWQELVATAAAVSASEQFADTSMFLGQVPAASASASLFGAVGLVIAHYANTANHKTVEASNAVRTGTTTGTAWRRLNAGFWRSTAAINRITVITSSGNFAIGTRATLYGMGGI